MAYTTTSATGAGDSRKNTTNYEHPQETNLLNVHKSMEYNVLGQPVLRTTLGPTASDAFGRFRVSNPFTLFDSFHRYADNGKNGVYTASGGVSTHDANSSVISNTVNGTLNSAVYRESTRIMAYQPGKSLMVLQTFVMAPARDGLRQRIGYFGASNGFFLEKDGSNIYFVKRSSSANGTPVETRVAKADWNITPLDGSGADKITLNLDVAQIMYTEIEWLGVGSVTQGFVIGAQFIPCHKWDWANETGSTTTYMGTGCLPVRAEILNTAATGVPDTMKVICTSVISEGGYEVQGRPRSVGQELNAPYRLASPNTVYPLLSIRLKSTNLDAIVLPKNFSLAVTASSNFRYTLRVGGVSSGGAWQSAGTDSSVEFNANATAHTGGIIFETGYVMATNQTSISPSLQVTPFKYQLERNSFTANATEFTLCAVTSGNNQDVYASFNWEEIT